jgi:2-phospho-L-lactate guanylyltransferase
VEWVLVIPVKRLTLAKSRIGDPWAPHRADLALAFAQDTVTAGLAAAEVVAVVVVTDDPVVAAEVKALGAEVVSDEPQAGQNAAVRHGAQAAPRSRPSAGVAAISADLPSLRTDELGAALRAAAAHLSAFVYDTPGTGTTMLTAAPGTTLQPLFGPGSRAAHAAAGVAELDGAWPSLRRDVDTAIDLVEARELGVGPATSAVLARLGAIADESDSA